MVGSSRCLLIKPIIRNNNFNRRTIIWSVDFIRDLVVRLKSINLIKILVFTHYIPDMTEIYYFKYMMTKQAFKLQEKHSIYRFLSCCFVYDFLLTCDAKRGKLLLFLHFFDALLYISDFTFINLHS